MTVMGQVPATCEVIPAFRRTLDLIIRLYVKTSEGTGFRVHDYLPMGRLTTSRSRGTLLLTSFPLPAVPLWVKESQPNL